MNIFQLRKQKESKKTILHYLRNNRSKNITIFVEDKEITVNRNELSNIIYNEMIVNSDAIKKHK